MKVLLIEDDKYLSRSICNYLEFIKLDVTCSYDGANALELIENEEFDLFLVDINIPYMSGLELLEHIRRRYIKTPVIIITASLEIANMEKAYENECNDYIKKPFDLKELELRITKLLDFKDEKIALTQNLVFDTKQALLMQNGESIHLRNKEYRLLELLVSKRNEIVTKEHIIEYVWKGEPKESYPLRQLLNELRKKLDSDLIKTEKNLGYCLQI